MSFNMNNGYSGWSMSNRAVSAYNNGEKPKSKWTKKAMLEAIKDFCWEENRKFENFDSLKKEDLFQDFFVFSSRHHTSKMCNLTTFYALDESAVLEHTRPLSDDEINLQMTEWEMERQKIEDWEKKQEKERLKEKEFCAKYGFEPYSFQHLEMCVPGMVSHGLSKKGNPVVFAIIDGEHLSQLEYKSDISMLRIKDWMTMNNFVL